MRYADFILAMLKKEREIDAAMDVVWQGDLFTHGMTQCAECGVLLHQRDAMVHVFYDHTGQKEEHFCPDKLQPELSCHMTWYLTRLRREGI